MLSNFNVLLLAAGFGTRLGHITKKTPKCLVKVGGKPMLEHWLEKIEKFQPNNIFVNTHYLSEQVTEFISSSAYASKVRVIHEEQLAGTGGTLLSIRDELETSPFLVAHVDNYTSSDLTELFIAHKTKNPKCLATVLTFRTDAPKNCGIFVCDENNIATEFYEKDERYFGNLANSAIYIFEPEMLKVFPPNELTGTPDISLDFLPKLVGRIQTTEISGELIDIGILENLEKARQHSSNSI